MSIDRLKYFAAVVETRNLRKAAEIVGISAPSMSKAISVLESELGEKLLYPEGRGIGITTKGLEVYRLSHALLDEYRSFHEKISRTEYSSERIRIATFEVFSSYFISSFLSVEESLEILMLEMTPGQIEQSILSGTVDFGLTYIPSPHNLLEYVEIGSFKMDLYGQAKWADVEFSKWPFAVPVTELKIHSSEVESLDMWPTKAPKRYQKYQFELLETALQTSRQGLSVLHCPDFIIQLHNRQVKPEFQLHSLPHPVRYKNPKYVKAYLVRKKGIPADRLERKLAKFFRSLV